MPRINSLSKDEKIAVMYLLNAISRADGKVEQAELDYLQYFTEEHHLVLDEELFKLQKLDQLCADIKSPEAKLFALEQVISISICDNNYHDTERKAALFLANMLGIAQSEFLLIEQTMIEKNASS